MPETPLQRWLEVAPSADDGVSGWSFSVGEVTIPVNAETYGLLGLRVICPRQNFWRGGLSRAALWAYQMSTADPGPVPNNSPPLIVEAWAWTAGAATLVATCTTLGFPMKPGGLLFQVSGVLADGYEFRARIAPGAGTFNVRSNFRIVCDRAGDPPGMIGPTGAALVASVAQGPL